MCRLLKLLAVSTMLLGAVGAVRATDVPITGLKLIVVDKTVLAGKAKAVFVAKDAAITKGAGTDPAQIEATLDVAYDSVSGAFDMPQGSAWLVNKDSVAKYVNRLAPTSGAAKVGVIKPSKLVKVVGKSLGDMPLDISSAPSGAVYVAETIVNGGETTRLCTQFAGCVHKAIAGGTGYKLTCKGNGSGDAACTAAVCLRDPGDGTIMDHCTGLQWEKKTTVVGSGVDAANLHDVDNTYRWAGHCSASPIKFCQPTAGAEAACKAQTALADWVYGCEQCVGGEGACTVVAPATTTVWDWVSQVNAADFAGHSDWRLPSEDGRNISAATPPHELETILLAPFPCGMSPCIDPIFGPTVTAYGYYSSSTYTLGPGFAWGVEFQDGVVDSGNKEGEGYVRAVRGGS